MIKPESGLITLNGKKINDYDYYKYRNKIGYVSQDNSIFNMSLIDNLCLRDLKIREKDIVDYLKSLISINLSLKIIRLKML